MNRKMGVSISQIPMYTYQYGAEYYPICFTDSSMWDVEAPEFLLYLGMIPKQDISIKN